MADENLSFAIVFEEANRLINGVKEASDALEGMKSAASTASAGLDDAARSAIAGADAFDNFGQAAAAASNSLQDISGAVAIDVDAAPLLETAEAAEAAAASADDFEAAWEAATGASEAMAAEVREVTSAVEDEERAARDAAEAAARLAHETEQAGEASRQAAGGFSGLAAAFGNLGTLGKAAIGSFAGLAALQGAEAIGRGIAGTFKTAIAEFAEAERAITALDAALQSTGKFSAQASAAIQDFASEIQRTTTFTDDAVVSAAALIAQVGQLGGEKLVQATEAAVQLSAVLGRDLSTTALLLARGAAGATEAFSRFGIVVKGAGTDAEKFDSILAQINSKFGGRAQADVETFSGSVKQLRNSWNEFLESVGKSVTVFEPAIQRLTQLIDKANQKLGVETVTSSLNAREALKEVAKAFDKAATGRREFRPIEVDGKVVFQDTEVERIRQLAKQAAVKIPISVVGGESIEAITADINELRAAAERLGDVSLSGLTQELLFALEVGKQQLKARVELEGAEKAKQGLKEVVDLVVELNSLGGQTPLELIDTKALIKAAATAKTTTQTVVRAMDETEQAVASATAGLGPFGNLFAESFQVVSTSVTTAATDTTKAANMIAGAVSAIIASAEAAQSIGGDVSGSQIVAGLKALDDAREEIMKAFGEMPAALEAAFTEAQDRLQAAARKLTVKVDLGIVGGFGQPALDALVAGFDQAEAEIKAFKDFIRATNAAAGADDQVQIQTEQLLQGVKTIQDITPLVEAAMERLRRATELKAVVGGPAANAGVFDLLRQTEEKSEALEKQFGETSAEGQAAFQGIRDSLARLIALYGELPGPVQTFADTQKKAGEEVSAAFGASIGTIVESAQKGTALTLKFFADMVKNIIKELNTLGTFDFIGKFLGPLGGVLGGIFRSIFGKADFPPITIPVDPFQIPVPTVPEPQVPKATVEPIEVPVEALPFEAPELPDLEPLLVPLALGGLEDFDAPTITAVQVPVEFLEPPPIVFEVPRVPAAVPPVIQIPVEFLRADLPAFDFPPVTVPVEVERPTIPALETVPASLEFARQRAQPATDTVPASLEFARLGRSLAAQETRLRREPLRVLSRIPAREATQITINATDGISVRRQLTAGALRREIERDFRRSGF